MLDTVHAIFEVIPKELALFKVAATLNVVGDTVKLDAAACVTVTVLLVTPLPDMVTVALRVLAEVFAAAVTVMVALFEPEAELTVNHV